MGVENVNAKLVGIVAVAADVGFDGRVCDSLVTALQQLDDSFSQFRHRFYLAKTQSKLVPGLFGQLLWQQRSILMSVVPLVIF